MHVVSSCLECGFIPEHGVCDDEQFAGDGNDHDLERFAFGLQARPCRRANCRPVPACGPSGADAGDRAKSDALLVQRHICPHMQLALLFDRGDFRIEPAEVAREAVALRRIGCMKAQPFLLTHGNKLITPLYAGFPAADGPGRVVS